PGDISEGQYPQAAVNAIMGAAMLHGAPEARTERPATASEAPEGVKTPVGEQTQPATEPMARPTQLAAERPVATGADEAAANLEAGQQGAAPESAEEAAPAATATAVRQPLTLDELRLMRERNDLQLQNDLLQRAGLGGHPAIDERIGQINDELDALA